MIVREFNYVQDFDLIIEWLTLRGLEVPRGDQMPRIGFVAWEYKTPVAASFLRMVEGGFALIDGLVTNPRCKAELRNKANDLLTERLLETAKELDISAVTAYSTDFNTVSRAKRFNFKECDHKVLIKSLTQKDNSEGESVFSSSKPVERTAN